MAEEEVTTVQVFLIADRGGGYHRTGISYRRQRRRLPPYRYFLSQTEEEVTTVQVFLIADRGGGYHRAKGEGYNR